MKNDGQTIRDSDPWNSRWTKDPHWLNNVFLLSTVLQGLERYDLPAMLNHVLTYTEKEKLHFVGHSMGSTTFMVTKSSLYPLQYCLDNVCQYKHIMRHATFMVTKSSKEVIQKPDNLHKIWVPLQVLNSLEPNWGDHIGVAVLLAPVAYIDHTTSPIRSCICVRALHMYQF